MEQNCCDQCRKGAKILFREKASGKILCGPCIQEKQAIQLDLRVHKTVLEEAPGGAPWTETDINGINVSVPYDD